MILLEFHNRIVEDTLKRAFEARERPEAIDVVASDFDGVLFHVSSTDDRTKILLSLRWACYKDLEASGVQEILDREYSDLVTATEDGYNVSLLVDLHSPPENHSAIIKKCALLKRNLLAAPFEQSFDLLLAKKRSSAPLVVNYRTDSSLYVLSQGDRVTVIFSITFQDADDVVIGKVFLQEFVDARKKVQEAPQVIFSKEPPAELNSLNLDSKANMSFVSFVLFARHFWTPSYKGPVAEDPKRENAINMLETFRDYLHYHIKCSKAHLHCRMRARVSEALKILNRAKPDVKTERKTASGKMFIRK